MASSKKTLPATKSDRMRKVRPMSDELRHEIETFAPRTRPRHIPAQIEGRIISRVTETPNLAMQPAVSITLVMHPNPSRTRRGVVMVRARTIIKNISGHLPSGNPNRGLACPVRHTAEGHQDQERQSPAQRQPEPGPGLPGAAHPTHRTQERPPPAQRPSHPGDAAHPVRPGQPDRGSAVHPARPGQARQSHLGGAAHPARPGQAAVRPPGQRALSTGSEQAVQASGQRALSTSSEQAVRASGGQAAVPPPDQRAPMDQFAQGMYRCMELIREFTELWGALHHFPPPPPFPNISRRRFERAKGAPVEIASPPPSPSCQLGLRWKTLFKEAEKFKPAVESASTTTLDQLHSGRRKHVRLFRVVGAIQRSAGD
ncbi:hypothetical protein PAPYR_12817 [Paratrimastix pyriformis]|uniref:Uncharacterized protein n=1 Tax=Paratrimastix pyriformis TaxID=342808 RepID=A0ABQ8U6D0_9EUKA|nr:hypothetical protein PAPYR_12817 [Paratrimastix pyriformis]